MHEAGLIEGILAEALAAAKRRNGWITRMEIEVCDHGHLSDELVLDQLRALSRGTAAEDALVELRRLDPAYRCFDCGLSFVGAVATVSADCPRCGGTGLPVETREEVALVALETRHREGSVRGAS